MKQYENMNRLIRKATVMHIMILIAVLIVTLIPDVSAFDTFVSNPSFNISIPDKYENLNIFGYTTPKIPITICNLKDSPQDFNIEVVSSTLGASSEFFSYDKDKGGYVPYSKTDRTAIEGVSKQLYDSKISLADSKSIETSNCIILYYQITIPTYEKKEVTDYFLGIPIGTKTVYSQLRTEYNITLTNTVDSKPLLTLDPGVTGCYEDDVIVRCNDTAFTGESIDTTKNVSIFNATVTGTGTLTINSTAGGSITIFNATLNGNGAAGNPGTSGQLIIKTTGTVIVNDSLLNGYGGSGNACAANGAPGSFTLNASEAFLNFTTINGYGGAGVSGTGCGSSGGWGYAGSATIDADNLTINKVTINSNAGNAGDGGAGSCSGICTGSGSFNVYSDNILLKNLSISSSGCSAGNSPNCNPGRSATGGVTEIYGKYNLTIINSAFTSNGGNGGAGSLGGFGDAGDGRFFIKNASNFYMNVSTISASAGGTGAGSRISNCTFIAADSILFDNKNTLTCDGGTGYIQFATIKEVRFNPSTIISDTGFAAGYPQINFNGSSTQSRARLGLFNTTLIGGGGSFNLWGVSYPTIVIGNSFGTINQSIVSNSVAYSRVNQIEYDRYTDFYALNITYGSIETETVNFTVTVYYNNSIVGNISDGTISFAGINYTADSSTNTSSNWTFVKVLTMPLINSAFEDKTFFWNYTANYLNGTSVRSGTVPTTDRVYQLVMGFCNSNSTINLTAPYINFTFKDEISGNSINATIASSVWHYWLNGSSGLINKTFVYSNTTHNGQYAFCVYPNFTQVNYDAQIQYASDEAVTYPQRIYKSIAGINNITTNRTLYLLSSAAGVYSSYITVTAGRVSISGVHIKVEETLDGGVTWIYITEGDTDDAGQITFWLNPNNLHRLTVSKIGYTTQQFVLYPTSSLYTITMGTGSSVFHFISYLDGITYSIYPPSGILQPYQLYNFTLHVNATKGNLQECRINLTNVSSGNLAGVSGCDAYGGNIQITNFQFNTSMYGEYAVKINNTWIFVETDGHWIDIPINNSNNLNLVLISAIKDLNNLTEFGSDPNKAEFSKIVFLFLLFAIIAAALNFYTGYDTAYPGALLFVFAGVCIILTVAPNGFLGPGFLYLYESTRICAGGVCQHSQFLDNWILTFDILLVSGIYFATIMRRYQT